MSGYHPITLPTRYSAGSLNTISYDTRVITLESGVEQRVARYNPWGRRKYTILQGITSTELIRGLYEFFMLREGSLNAFKFWDPLDHATTPTRTTHRENDATVGITDTALVSLGNRMYQCVVRYSDGVRTIVRPITKLGKRDDAFGAPNPGVYSINGVVTTLETVDPETGIVTFGGVATINFAEAGFEYLVPVRFADNTDKAFQIAMQSTTETQELPGFDLIEELDPRTISQDYNYGGSRDWGFLDGNFQTSEINGRVQLFNPQVGSVEIFLPHLDDVPLGGPIFVFRNVSAFTLDIVAHTSGAFLFQMPAMSVVEIFAAANGSSKQWVFFA